jgi:ribosomal protein L32E
MARTFKWGYKGWRMPDAGSVKQAATNAKDKMTNELFASSNPEFLEACKKADLKPTARQASKWRRQMGLAYKTRVEAGSTAAIVEHLFKVGG